MTDQPILTEADERAHLQHVRERLQAEIERVNALVGEQFQNVLELKTYLSESKSDMDHVEKVAVRESVDQMGRVGDHSARGLLRLRRLLASAYFGRIDFRAQNTATTRPLYIGIHSFHDSGADRQLVHDWRAPVSSMFYDFETGPASYVAPSGTETGEIERKRQYRIEEGRLVFQLESSLSIHDDVLQQELSRASTEKMKNIVATIQRDQNAIVRNDVAPVLVIQGAAGSGKTSIALHRIAFLLYRHRDSIRAEDVLILSPNKVFAHYISNVLPELGEENIRETTMETLAQRLLGEDVLFQTFFEQVAALLAKSSGPLSERIRFKATPEFLARLDAYLVHVKNTNFTPADVQVGRHTVEAALLRERHDRQGLSTYAARINELVSAIADDVQRRHRYELKAADRTAIRKQLKRMFGSIDTLVLYKRFYEWLEEPALCRPAARGVLEYSDVFPLLYFKMQTEGVAGFDEVKHLVVDEMQDYTQVQYTVLAQLFPCRKTILGDAFQSVNPFGSSTAESICAVFPGAQCVHMNRSYRSTLEIANLAQRIRRNEHLEPIERHGEEPRLVACADRAAELEHVAEAVSAFGTSGFKALGIVCRTQADAVAVHERVRDLRPDIALLDAASSRFGDGVTIATAHLAKGLEFDQVVLPFCGDEHYRTELDRQMLYVGCTRAMHRLLLVHSGPLTRFLRD